MNNKPTDIPASAPRLHIAMLSWLGPHAEGAMMKFRREVAPLWERYDLRVERALVGTGKGQIVGSNLHPIPHLLQVISFPSLATFQAYAQDDEYLRLAKERDAHVECMVAALGTALDVSALHPESDSPLGERLYGLGFLRFQGQGAAGLADFNRRASSLFLRHGMHVELMFDVARTVTPIGEPLPGFAPERVIVFYLDDPGALAGYASDSEYIALAPIRDRGLAAYDFFLGKISA